jgi:hypothetical protein
MQKRFLPRNGRFHARNHRDARELHCVQHLLSTLQVAQTRTVAMALQEERTFYRVLQPGDVTRFGLFCPDRQMSVQCPRLNESQRLLLVFDELRDAIVHCAWLQTKWCALPLKATSPTILAFRPPSASKLLNPRELQRAVLDTGDDGSTKGLRRTILSHNISALVLESRSEVLFRWDELRTHTLVRCSDLAGYQKVLR